MTPNEAAIFRAQIAAVDTIARAQTAHAWAGRLGLLRPAAALGRLAAHGSVDGDSGASGGVHHAMPASCSKSKACPPMSSLARMGVGMSDGSSCNATSQPFVMPAFLNPARK